MQLFKISKFMAGIKPCLRLNFHQKSGSVCL